MRIAILVAVALLVSLAMPSRCVAQHVEVWNPQELLQLYARALAIIPNQWSDKVMLLIEPHNLERSHLKLAGEVVLVADRLGQTSVSEELEQRLDTFLVPNLWVYQQQRKLRPAEEDIIAYRNSRPDAFGTADWISGAYMLIPDSPTSETVSNSIRQKLDRDSSNFRDVARDFYRTQGEDRDGHFERIQRGQIASELFEAFFTHDPRESYFTKQVRHGYLIGKVLDRGVAGWKPLDRIHREIEQQIVADRMKAHLATFFKNEEKRQHLERRWNDSGEEAPPPDETAYSIRGKSVSYRDVLSRLVEVLGDRSSMAFFRSVTEDDIREQLVLGSSEAEEVRRSPEYAFAFEVLRAHAEYSALMRSRLDSEPTTRTLREFYESHLNQFALPDEVRFIAIELTMQPPGEATVAEKMAYRQRAWPAICHLRSELASSTSPLTFSIDGNGGAFGARRFQGQEWMALSEIPPPFGRVAASTLPGETSNVQVGPHTWFAVHVAERRKGETPSFEQVAPQVRTYYQVDQMKKIREALLYEALHALTRP